MKETDSFESVIKSLMEGAEAVLASKTVVGEPILLQDTFILPLSDVTIGCAGGTGAKKNAGMGGFHAKMSPSAVLLVKDGNARIINIKDQNYVNKLIDLAPNVLDRLVNLGKESGLKDEEAVKQAFPEGTEKGGAQKKP